MSIRNNLKKILPVSNASEKTDQGRREAVKKLGIFGAYTAPALIAMMRSAKAVAASCPVDHDGGDDD